MKEQLETIRREALSAMKAAADSAALEELRVRFLGKKGELTAVLKQMGKLSAEERPIMGQAANEVRAAIEQTLERVRAALDAKALEARLRSEAVDVTIPGSGLEMGHRHPMYIALDELKEIFIGMGFDVLDGPGRRCPESFAGNTARPPRSTPPAAAAAARCAAAAPP